MKNTYCVCYNRLSIFKSKELAKKFFTTCYYASEGAEQERYANILIDLQFSNIGTDKQGNLINEYIILDDYNSPIKKEKTELINYKLLIEQFEKGAENIGK